MGQITEELDNNIAGDNSRYLPDVNCYPASNMHNSEQNSYSMATLTYSDSYSEFKLIVELGRVATHVYSPAIVLLVLMMTSCPLSLIFSPAGDSHWRVG